MYNDSSPQYLEEHPSLAPVNISIFENIIGRECIERMQQLAAPLEGKEWAHVSSTFAGGGVAEMLQSIVPITRGLGIDSNWFCIEGPDDFFVTTKKFHNAIQGVNQDFSLEELFHTYIETNKNNFNGQAIHGDMIIVHDPQPCASIVHGNYQGNVIWRCHIDTTEADPIVWNFLLPYINHYDGALFSHRNFIKEGIKVPTYIVTPAINPLNVKNKPRTEEEACDTLSDLFEEYDIDPDRPIVLAVSRYDVHKNQGTIISAFKKLKEDPVFKRTNPQLILVGNLAPDDPEGEMMYQKILTLINGDPDIKALLNIPNNDENIGALMKLADVFVHISTKEGFGLVVTEAMWQATPVIGSDIGGIALQVLDGKTGFTVDPFDEDKVCQHLIYLLEHPEERQKMGEQAREHVRDNFLVTGLIEKYLILMRYLLRIEVPSFAL